MQHSFDADIAAEYGINEAVLLNNITFWVFKNASNEYNFFDGRYWTYNSVKAYSKLFPYMSDSTIKRSLKHLKDEGLILTGNYNNDPSHRTNYYTLTDKGMALVSKRPYPLGQNDTTDKVKMTNSIFNNNTDSTDINNTDINEQIDSVVSAENAEKEIMFEQFWEAYPKCFRKVNKKGSKAKFLKIANLKEIFPDIMRSLDVQKRSKQWNEQDGKFIPMPTTWINEERWTLEDTRTEVQTKFDEAADEHFGDFLLGG